MTMKEQFFQHPVIFSILIIILLALLLPVLYLRIKCIIGKHEEKYVWTPFGGFYKCKNCNKRL